MSRKQLSLFKPEDTSSTEKWDGLPEEKLKNLIPVYQENKVQMDAYKKVADRYNKEIKSVMKDADIKEFEVGDLRAVYSVSKRENFIEEALIEKIKALKIRGVVKKKEYVDMDALENAIYNGKVDAATLADCKETKEVITLRISKAKGKE